MQLLQIGVQAMRNWIVVLACGLVFYGPVAVTLGQSLPRAGIDESITVPPRPQPETYRCKITLLDGYDKLVQVMMECVR